MLQKIHLEKEINAPRQAVWDKIVNLDSYKIWAKIFDENSTFEGKWIEGEKIHFLGGNSESGIMGMVSILEKVTEPDYISIRHIGMILNGKEDLTSDEVLKWKDCYENYTLVEENGVTTFKLDLYIPEEYVEMMESMWKKAFERLKILCEMGEIKPITIEVEINSNLENVWEAWTNPTHITKWAFASDTWESPNSINNLEENGIFSTRMQEIANPENGFEFSGINLKIEKQKYIKSLLVDGRYVEVKFEVQNNKVKVVQTFEAEQNNPLDLQRDGWLSILNNFKKYVETM
jgi:uncharacterized protein YndB with AHSA1/START domain